MLVIPCYYCWWHSGSHQWTRTFPNFPPLQWVGKWFSSSLALGTDIVADIADRIPSDMPCYHDRARCHRSFYFNPHGGPITHSSTGSEPDPPVYLLLRSIICSWLCVLSQATVREMILFSMHWTPFTLCFRHRMIACPLKLLMVPSYFALEVFLRFNSRHTSATFPELFTSQSIL